MGEKKLKNKQKKVLVVDDEPQICQLICDYLKKKGFLTQVAHNGKMAMQFTKESSPDLIILDVIMPVMDGLEFLRCLRLEKDYARIPVIMLTAKSSPEDVEKGISLEADFYLPKPVQFDNLMNFVNLILK
jgi:DNA-binding response OmpR family regulator